MAFGVVEKDECLGPAVRNARCGEGWLVLVFQSSPDRTKKFAVREGKPPPPSALLNEGRNEFTLAEINK